MRACNLPHTARDKSIEFPGNIFGVPSELELAFSDVQIHERVKICDTVLGHLLKPDKELINSLIATAIRGRSDAVSREHRVFFVFCTVAEHARKRNVSRSSVIAQIATARSLSALRDVTGVRESITA